MINAAGVLKVEGVENPWIGLNCKGAILDAVTVVANGTEAEWVDDNGTWFGSYMCRAHTSRDDAYLYISPIDGDTEEVRINVFGLNTYTSMAVKLNQNGKEYSVTYVKES